MKVYHSLNEVPKIQNLILTQGTFDGVHLGHQKVLKHVVNTAQKANGESMLLTFYPHPRLVLYPNDNSLRLLNSIEEKADLIALTGIDHMLILPFTDAISNLAPIEFVRNILVETLNIQTMIVGYDHRFGKNREGSFENLVEFGDMFNFNVQEIPASEIEDIAISSTRIRKALLAGELQLANELLGRYYKFSGVVIHGKKLGRTIGFPTANIGIRDPYKLIPSSGVYAVFAHIQGQRYPGAANIGWNPTIDGKGFSIEVHLFDFQKDIYNCEIELEMVQFLRPEEKFKGIEELTVQIEKDVAASRAILRDL
ncbi:MAG: bifunctional riboflavin kinase/FAD synthetase [Bacteroidia bacterium]|nr:bifunctional riboflavin kinase/FAD synthetase [Bacteroidia bacterium]